MRKAATPHGAGNTLPARGISEATRRALHLLLLSLIAITAYSNTFHNPFVFDDLSSIVENEVIKDLPRFLSGAGYAFNPRRFIGYLSFAVNFSMGGLDSFGYHLVNLAVHLASGWLVYFLVGLTLGTPFFDGAGRRDHLSLVPLFAALLFVAHPVQTQAVTYIVQRLASLATLFYLLALFCYVRGRLALCSEPATPADGPTAASPGALRPSLFFLGSLVFALLAVQTKEIAATLPLIVLLYEFCFFKPGKKRNVLLLLSLLLVAALFIAGMLSAGKPLGELLSDVNDMTRESLEISRGAYLITQFSVIATYLRLLFLPVNQNLDYDYPVYHSLFAPPVFFSFLLLLVLLAGAAWLYHRSSASAFKRQPLPSGAPLLAAHCARLAAFGICWFFITLSVESSVIPISDVIFEHRLYLPSVGAFLALAAGAVMLFRGCSLRILYTGAAVVAVILGCATWQRNLVWETPLTLWGDVVSKSPGKSRANNHYGVALSKVGRTEEAVQFLKVALQIDPRNGYVLYNLGRMFDETGNIDQAISCYQSAIDLKPDLAVAHNNLAVDYLLKGRDDQAIECYRVALKLKPGFAEAHNNLGFVLKSKGRIDEAIQHYQAALRGNGRYAKAYSNLGAAYQEKGELDLAISQFQEAARLKPDDPASRENLAKALQLKGSRR